ncbi:MAG: phosphatase PAP2 family protein [Bacteroidales bacterium]
MDNQWKTTWDSLYLAIIVLLAFRYRSRMLIIVPLIVLAITASDQLSVHAFKEVFMRLRPCHEPSLEGLVHIVNGKCPGKYGFVSSHASNSFVALLLSLLLVRRRWSPPDNFRVGNHCGLQQDSPQFITLAMLFASPAGSTGWIPVYHVFRISTRSSRR